MIGLIHLKNYIFDVMPVIVRKIMFSVVLFLLLLEILLRLTGTYQTADERDSGTYTYRYHTSRPTWYHTWGAGAIIDYVNPEFTYTNRYNNLGNRELDADTFFADTSSYKIICIGDSFTEGDGAPADSTWVKRLEKRMNNGKSEVKLYNAGVCGSDVLYNNKLLSGKLINRGVAAVIECLNYSDVYDVIYRGGNDRFNEDGTTTCKVGPCWEKLYANIYLFRPFTDYVLGYNAYLVERKKSDELEWNALEVIMAQVEQTAAMCRARGVKYWLVIHPHTGELTARTGHSKVEQVFGNKAYVLNLFPAMNRFYSNNKLADYSWKINGHFNGKGYLLMGDMIYDELNRKKITLD